MRVQVTGVSRGGVRGVTLSSPEAGGRGRGDKNTPRSPKTVAKLTREAPGLPQETPRESPNHPNPFRVIAGAVVDVPRDT